MTNWLPENNKNNGAWQPLKAKTPLQQGWSYYPQEQDYSQPFLSCTAHPKSFNIAGKYSVIPTKNGDKPGCNIRFYLDAISIPDGSMWGGFRSRAGNEKAIFVKWTDFGTIPVIRFEAIIEYIKSLAHGKKLKIAIGCMMGHGRTGTLIAGLLIHEGATAKEAMRQVREHLCHKCIETKGQETLLEQYERRRYFLKHGKELPLPQPQHKALPVQNDSKWLDSHPWLKYAKSESSSWFCPECRATTSTTLPLAESQRFHRCK